MTALSTHNSQLPKNQKPAIAGELLACENAKSDQKMLALQSDP
jgi:hypothetical protein